MEYHQLDEIVTPLITWYHKNRRDMPWRADKEPYHVWVSEIMLQQTRVEAVIPYYERFMKQFPTVEALAACDDEALFKAWEGLGYYSRARNLKKAAQTICEEYKGQFPNEYEEIFRLSGIGAYTAGAISSIAFEKAHAAVDGNVLRVITRLTQDCSDIMDTRFRRQVTEELEKIYPLKERGDFTQSLMELGAVVCVPNGKPKCGECPLAFGCGAYQNNTQLEYPVKKKKAARKIEEKTILILTFQNKTAIDKRSQTGILSGLWELPNIDGKQTKQQIRKWLADKKITAGNIRRLSNGRRQLKHIFTHVEWHMTCWAVDCESVREGNGFTWVSSEQLENEIALPTAFKKCFGFLRNI